MDRKLVQPDFLIQTKILCEWQIIRFPGTEISIPPDKLEEFITAVYRWAFQEFMIDIFVLKIASRQHGEQSQGNRSVTGVVYITAG